MNNASCLNTLDTSHAVFSVDGPEMCCAAGQPVLNVMPVFERVALIYNPAARRVQNGGIRELQQVANMLGAQGSSVEMLATWGPNAASKLARRAVSGGADLIIACGGDGTINEVLAGVALSQVPLLILPGGTANVLAKELGLSNDWSKVVALLGSGQVRRISLGKMNGRYFILMAGIGVDAGIVRVVNPKIKRLLGEGSFWLAGFRQWFRYRFEPFQVKLASGERYQATFALVSKARHYGGPFQLTPEAEFFSDQFDVCLFQGRSRWRYLRYLWSVTWKQHVRLPDVKHFKTDGVEVEGSSSIGVQVDGELVGHLPQRFTIEKQALRLIVPR
ncbi:MAG: diacylglycerol kinase family protein [Acidobacteriota bacterium]